MTILPLTYFGPIGWWNILLSPEIITFDIHENYIKQTYRNRCTILTANGPLNLIVPVKKIDGNHTLLKNIKIENTQHWQLIHFRAILSAYKASPYFDYFIDDIAPIWNKKYDFLIDVCLDSLSSVSSILKKKTNTSLSHSYIVPSSDDVDLRKCAEFPSDSSPYTQVFNDRFEFVNNLSILDKLFNDYTNV